MIDSTEVFTTRYTNLFCRDDGHIRKVVTYWSRKGNEREVLNRATLPDSSKAIVFVPALSCPTQSGVVDVFFECEHKKWKNGEIAREIATLYKDCMEWHYQYVSKIPQRAAAAEIAKETLTGHAYKKKYRNLTAVRGAV